MLTHVPEFSVSSQHFCAKKVTASRIFDNPLQTGRSGVFKANVAKIKAKEKEGPHYKAILQIRYFFEDVQKLPPPQAQHFSLKA